MRLPLSGRVEVAVASLQDRPTLTHVFLRIIETKTGRGRNRKTTREGWLEATDSYLLAKVPVGLDDGDTEGMIPVAALIEARQGSRELAAENGEVRLQEHGKTTLFARPEMGKFPDTTKLFTEDPPVFSIGLNAKYLAKLADALGSDTVRLDFVAPRKAIRVTGMSYRDGCGLLMPLVLPDDPPRSVSNTGTEPKP